jgi:hypothetical protein
MPALLRRSMDRLILLHARLPATLTLLLIVTIGWIGWCAYRNRLDQPAQILIGINQWLVSAIVVLGLVQLPGADLRLLALHLIYALIGLGILPLTGRLLAGRADRAAALYYLAALTTLLVVTARAAATGG